MSDCVTSVVTITVGEPIVVIEDLQEEPELLFSSVAYIKLNGDPEWFIQPDRDDWSYAGYLESQKQVENDLLGMEVDIVKGSGYVECQSQYELKSSHGSSQCWQKSREVIQPIRHELCGVNQDSSRNIVGGEQHLQIDSSRMQCDSSDEVREVQCHNQNDVKVNPWASQYAGRSKEIGNSIVTQRCCAKNCGITNVTGKLYPFPYIFRNMKGTKVVNRAGLERCREWIRLSGNMALLNVNPGHLINAYYMCCNHFNAHQYDSRNNTTLKKTAIPSLFDCIPISQDFMSVYDLGWNIKEFNEDAFLEYIEKNIVDITEEEQLAVNEGEEVVDSSALSCGSVVDQSTDSNQKKCCVRGCSNIYEKLFSFPNLYKKSGSVINISAVQKCREWLRKCGNPILLNRNPSKLSEKVYVCRVHFTEDCFLKNNNSKLKVAAIPSQFKYSSLSDEVMHTFDMEWKIGHILSKTITAFEEVEEKEVASENDLCGGLLEENSNFINKAVDKPRMSNLQKCCYVHCKKTNRNCSLVRFPNVFRKMNGVMQVDEAILDRFFKWLRNVGNIKLLVYDPKFIKEKYFVCKDHFGDECFKDMNRDKLNSAAIPYCSDDCLSEEVIQGYVTNVQKWRASNFGPGCFDVDKKAAMEFEDEMKNLKWNECDSCKEKFLAKGSNENVCIHRDNCWQYTGINNMDPGDIPAELQDLTFIEERLIARVHPMISVYMLTRNGQYGYRKNVINFSQKIDKFVKELPMKICDLNSVLIVRKKGQDNTYHDFNVRAAKVRSALLWLKANNKYYSDIDISEDNLNLLPENSNVSDHISSYSEDADVKEINKDALPGEEVEEDIVHDEPQRTVMSDVVYPHQDQQIKKYLNWPTLESEPINERSTPGYIACAFPTLFCYGSADLQDWHEKDVQVSNYFKHLLRFRDGRFAKHKTFRFFAYNSWMRWTALTDGNVFVNQNQQFKNLTVSQLKELLNENSNILKKVMFHAKNLRGSKAYWHSRCGELHDMMNQLRMPTIFLTLSAADLHWEDLYRLLTGKDDLTDLPEYERHKLLRENPQVVDEFFDMRVNAFLDHVLIKKYKVVDYWYRIEYQHRGSPHLHGVFWFEDAPNCENIEKASVEELDVIVDYFKDLITAINPDSHSENNEGHPCRRRYENIKDFQKDLAQLLNTVQRHTRCSPDYCIRYNKKCKENKCRFGFPILDLNDQARCQCKESGDIEFCPARNDDRLNKYNQFIIQLWRANMDIAPVLSKKRLLAYLSKYISKSEISSMCLHQLMSTIIERMNEDTKCVRAIQSFFIKGCVERDISAQEVSHILLGLKLHSSGKRKFVIINFSNKNWCQVVNDSECEDAVSAGKSFIEKYKDRPGYRNHVSLWDAAKKYNSVTWKSVENRSENIVRVFPRIKLKQDDENDYYYEQQVYLHVPWRDEAKLRLENETWQEAYIRHGVANVQVANDLLENVVCDDLEDDDDDDDELVCNFYEGELHRGTPEEWMISSNFGHGRIEKIELGKREVDMSYPWMESSQLYEQYGTMEEFQNFIRRKKKDAENSGEEGSSNVDEHGSVVTLSIDQQKVLNLVSQQIEHIETNGMEDIVGGITKTCIVQGKAGTGKSLVISEMTKLLKRNFGDESYMVGTPTGVSALLINGRTVHSIFRIPRETKNFKPLTGVAARKLINEFSNVKFLIIDEYSMCGSRLIGMLSARCQEATGNYRENFGGLFTYFFGDIKQLPPVKDRPIYSYNQKSNLSRSGYKVMKSIQSCIILNKIHRQNDNQFLDILSNISEGASTREDFDVLKSRMKGTAKDEHVFDDAMNLFATKEEVRNFNVSKLAQLRDANNQSLPVLKVEARVNCARAKKASIDEAQGLEQNLYIAKGCKIMLKSNLWLKKGLVNGAMGKIVDVLYDKNEVSIHFPTVLLCEFDNYTGPSIIPDSNIVPIPTILSTWINRHNEPMSRIQFPIALSYACSIHKSQGLTLSKAVVHLGDKEFALGLTYVAMSRVKCLKNLLFYPFSFSRIRKLNSNNLALRNDFLNSLKVKCIM